MTSPFCTIQEAIAEVAAGRLIVLVDDEKRENEGDLVCAAEKVTPETINFMRKFGGGLLCLALTRQRCEELRLEPQVQVNTTRFGTAFMVQIDAHPRFGVTTGVSAADRSTTIRRTVDDQARPDDFVRPGHIDPLMARDGGVLVRAGQTEGSVDLARLAGLRPAAVLIEIMNDDGTMARVPQLTRFCQEHGLRMCTVADLIQYRMQREQFVRRATTTLLPSIYGEFKLIAYESDVDHLDHLALCCGGVGELDAKGNPIPHDEPVLVRVDSECLTGQVFGSLRCDCGPQLHKAMELIQKAGKGAIIYLRQEGRGIGLINKLRAYHLQEQGFDTVQANEELGFPADRRDYGVGAQILRDLGLRNLRILTNNPKKVSRLEVYGLKVCEQVNVEIPPNPYNIHYLRTKKAKLGHQLSNV
jgi:3,4-dihydroxy 2-butanone 4-phosphate synthase / GTP cyclohydrolase II